MKAFTRHYVQFILQLLGRALGLVAPKADSLPPNDLHLQKAINSLVSFVAILKPDGTFVSANQALLDSLGLSREQIAGVHLARTTWFQSLEAKESQLEQALNTANRGQTSHLELSFSSAQNKRLDVDLIIAPLLTEDGNIQNLVMTGSDVTDRTRREEDFKRAELAAELANEAKTLFLANMSHEIRTPLGVMLGFAELLRDPSLLADEKGRYLDSIIRNGHQLTRIINEVLDVSKIEFNQLEIEKVDFSLNDMMADVLSLMKLKSQEKGLAFSFSSNSKTNWINSDPTRIRQILINIIGNAVKFTSTGEVAVELRVEPLKTDSKKIILIFDIIDSGPGINSDQRQTLFRPFSQADSSMTRKFGGTGLGLYLSRKLTLALGGELELLGSSLPVSGAHFHLKIPVRVAEDRLAHTDEYREKALQSDASLKGTRILVVEDSMENQLLITRYLRNHQADVECAENGLIGSEKALANNYNLVLMDIQMPIMDGYGAIQRLRELNYKRPVIALTAHAFADERERCFKLGFDEHLVKPIDRLLLLETVKRYAVPIHETPRYETHSF